MSCSSKCRLQRWAWFLSGFKYNLQYVKGLTNGGADGFSRLLIKDESLSGDNFEADYFNFLVESKIPIDAKQIRIELRKDPVLSQVYYYVKNGWPNTVDDTLKPYFIRANELIIDNNLLLWGYRVIIPRKFILKC